jgi:hypothetical protein
LSIKLILERKLNMSEQEVIPQKKKLSLKVKLIIGFVAVIALILISNIKPNPYKSGVSALERGDYEKAIKYLGKITDENKADADAKLELAKEKYFSEFTTFYNSCYDNAESHAGKPEKMLNALLPAYDRALIVEKILLDDNRVRKIKIDLEGKINALKYQMKRR